MTKDMRTNADIEKHERECRNCKHVYIWREEIIGDEVDVATTWKKCPKCKHLNNYHC